MIFDIFKTVIIEQNKFLLKEIATKFDMDYDTLVEKYIKPEYYLPVVLNTNPSKSKKNHK